jgi:hypothetical protein
MPHWWTGSEGHSLVPKETWPGSACRAGIPTRVLDLDRRGRLVCPHPDRALHLRRLPFAAFVDLEQPMGDRRWGHREPRILRSSCGSPGGHRPAPDPHPRQDRRDQRGLEVRAAFGERFPLVVAEYNLHRRRAMTPPIVVDEGTTRGNQQKFLFRKKSRFTTPGHV